MRREQPDSLTERGRKETAKESSAGITVIQCPQGHTLREATSRPHTVGEETSLKWPSRATRQTETRTVEMTIPGAVGRSKFQDRML